MKKIDLTKSKDLLKLRESINSILENKINTATSIECANSIDSLSFSDIKCLFEGICDRLYETKNGKKLISRYVKALRENKVASTIYTIYEAFKNPIYTSSPNEYVSEALKISECINSKNAKECTKKIASIVKECLLECGISEKEFNDILNENKAFNKSFDVLLEGRSLKNLGKYVDSIQSMKSYISEHMKEDTVIDENINIKELVKQLSESTSSSNYWEDKITKDVILNILGNGKKEELFEAYKKSCLSKIDTILNEGENIEEKSQLSSMKLQLEKKEFNENTLTEDLLKLAELENTLEN